MSVNDYYLGKEMSVVSADAFVLQNIEPSMRDEESALMETKWWDYRTMHPTQATAYFVSQFYATAQRYARRKMEEKYERLYGFRANSYDFRKESTATIRGWWRARQAADAIGCPYNVFAWAIIEQFRNNYHLFKTTKTGKQQLPFPVQMYSKPMIDAALRLWEERQKIEFVLPENELILGGKIHWFSPEMEQHYLKYAASRQNPERAKQVCLDKGII